MILKIELFARVKKQSNDSMRMNEKVIRKELEKKVNAEMESHANVTREAIEHNTTEEETLLVP